MKIVEIFENVTAKRTFFVKQFFFRAKTIFKVTITKPRVQPLFFSVLLLSSFSLFFFLSFSFFSVLLQLIGPKKSAF